MNRKTIEDRNEVRGADSLNAVLQAQLQSLKHIEEILMQERAALENRDPDSLLSVADAKHRALADLGNLESQRKTLSRDLKAEDVEQLRLVATRCRRMNTQNAALLNMQQRHVNRLLTLLRGGGNDQPPAYDSNGRPTATTSKQLRLTQT